MSHKNGKKIIIKIAVAIAAIAVIVLLFVIPFRSKNSKDGKTYSPIVPWYIVQEEYLYFMEPSNPPLIGDWDLPERTVKRKVIVFGKEYRSETYLEYEDGRVKKI